MKAVFLDSSFFKAVIDTHDNFYSQARKTWQLCIDNTYALYTTNYILDETYTLVRVKCDLKKALELRDALFGKKIDLAVIRVTVDDDAAAWEWFEKDWSKLSYTDCVSFAVMKRLGITSAATFDAHFARAGFQVLPAPRKDTLRVD